MNERDIAKLVQEQSDRIDELEHTVEEQNDRIEELEETVEREERRVERLKEENDQKIGQISTLRARKDELAESYHALRERVEEVEEERDALGEQVSDLARANAELRQEKHELKERVEELEAQFSEETDRLARNQAQNSGRISDLEETVEETAEETGVELPDHATPMEQIAALPEPIAEEQFDNSTHRNTFRGRFIVRGYTDFSENTPSGRVIANSDLCRILSAVEERTVESKTGSRVMRRIADLGRDKFRHVPPEENKRGEHLLVLEPDATLACPTSGGGGVVS